MLKCMNHWSQSAHTVITKKVLKTAIQLAVIVPTATAAVITAVNGLKRQKRKRAIRFPYVPPQKTVLGGTHTTIYTYGEQLYADMLVAIEAAQETVFLETYIWKNDAIGQRFKDALIAAHRRGVKVYIIIDGFANLVVPFNFYYFPAGIEVLRFPTVRPQTLFLSIRHTGRDHRKILVVDNNVAFIGGYNIGSVYATEWRDTHLRITGPTVWELSSAFTEFWNLHRKAHHPSLPIPPGERWNLKIEAASNFPGRRVYPIRNIYLEAIRRATDHIYLTQAYFIPDTDLIEALVAACARGVDVKLIVPKESNHVVTDWLARGLYGRLLEGGVKIYLYKNAMVHAKTATVDGIWTTIGTANIDRLSLTGNYEINMSIIDEDLAQKMDNIFELDLSNCEQLELERWNERSFLMKLGEQLISPLTPFL